MKELKVGEIIKVQVIGFQHYGIFIKCLDDEEYSGLIHISEISNDFVKDVTKIARLNDIIYAKILDVDTVSKHIKLSIKAIKPKVRYKTNYSNPTVLAAHSDFTPLGSRLNAWINEQFKEQRNND